MHAKGGLYALHAVVDRHPGLALKQHLQNSRKKNSLCLQIGSSMHVRLYVSIYLCMHVKTQIQTCASLHEHFTAAMADPANGHCS